MHALFIHSCLILTLPSMSSFLLPSFTSLVLILLHFFVLVSSTEVTHDGRAIIIDGEKKLLFSGSIHYPRSTPEVLIKSIIKFHDYVYDYCYL